jgi:hypothetical protein
LQPGTSLELAIEEMKARNQELNRSQPYILKIKPATFFVMIDDCAIAVQPSSMAVALDTLFKTFYVFNTEYPKSLSVMYGFLSYFLYKLKGHKATPKAQKLWTDIFNVNQ